jgi:hypothetical protein
LKGDAPLIEGLVDRRAALAVAARPRLWVPAVTLILRSAPRGWWRRWPPLPSPSAAFAEFRVHTAIGGPAVGGPAVEGAGAEECSTDPGGRHQTPVRTLDADEVVAFLEWCRRMTLLSKQRRRGPTRGT